MTVWGFDQPRASKLKALADHVGYASSAGARSPVALQARWEAWIFLTPAGGIPAMTGTTPGVATCSSFFINGAKDLDVTRADPASMLRNVDRPVYNISTTAIAGNTYVMAVDVSGDAVAIAPGGGALDCDGFRKLLNDCDLCEWLCQNCDTFTDCSTCCGDCVIEADGITNLSVTVDGTAWTQVGDSRRDPASNCVWMIDVEDTGSNPGTVGLAKDGWDWKVSTTAIGGPSLPTTSDTNPNDCNGTQTFSETGPPAVSGSFDVTGTDGCVQTSGIIVELSGFTDMVDDLTGALPPPDDCDCDRTYSNINGAYLIPVPDDFDPGVPATGNFELITQWYFGSDICCDNNGPSVWPGAGPAGEEQNWKYFRLAGAFTVQDIGNGPQYYVDNVQWAFCNEDGSILNWSGNLAPVFGISNPQEATMPGQNNIDFGSLSPSFFLSNVVQGPGGVANPQPIWAGKIYYNFVGPAQ